MIRHPRFRTAGLALLSSVALARPAAGQGVLERTPNLTGGWTAPPGVLQFNLLHRFDVSPAPARKVTNTPTLLVGYGVSDVLMVGFNYGSSSDLVANYPNEWEFFGRLVPLRQRTGSVVDVSLQGGYNLATESVDGELLVARTLGPVRLLAAGRALSDGPGTGDTRYAAAGGVALRLREGLSVSADVAGLLDREEDEDVAWGAGVQVGVPYTPHTLSIHATNVGTATLAGASRGSGVTRWGFEYTIPITLRRYLPADGGEGEEMGPPERGGEAPAGTRAPEGEAMAADTVEITIENLAYGTEEIRIAPGTTVRWVNADPLQHSVTSDDGAFDSGLIDPGASWAHTFEDAGAYPYHCTPHPFMTGRIVVREPETDR
ncbi:MAG: plastocyanin/azurin family copper-binding protein [Gemmatimonadota bacterium]|jgi:plastocyanin